MWHVETISPATEATLELLRDASLLEGFYLAGGTALALHLGHRTSEDLDFFAEALFDEAILLQYLQTLTDFHLVSQGPHTIHAGIQGTKVSFLGYAYPLLCPFAEFLRVRVADIEDIACIKISAIAARGTKRDFIDLYAAAQSSGLKPLLDRFGRKFAGSRQNMLHVLKSLTYFADAEKDPMPHMLVPMNWEDVKRFFLREALPLA